MMASARFRSGSAGALSVRPAALIRTLRAAPRMPPTAARAATPASEAYAALPCCAIASASGRAFSAASIVFKGTEAA